MANYFYVTIKSEKMTQEVANKILQEMVNKNKIRNFVFHQGYLHYNTRGLTDIISILNEYEFTDEEVEIKDEFDLVYECMDKPQLRSEEELQKYEEEAFDKVWLMRTSPCDIPEIETSRQEAVKRIMDTYDDIPEDGYDDWGCGFWNGVMATCRWALGDEEKDNLDT
jgi:hypothetical protein